MRVANRKVAITLFAALGVAARAAGSPAGAQIQQTADVAKRGLTPANFPRTRQLTPNVYTYEALRDGDPGGFKTTVNLVVITTDGVLVADGQGNVAQTKELVDWIRKTTSQPIKYVVVCSEHGDHTGGNAAFPAGVTFFAHPVSKKALEDAGKPPFPTEAVPFRRVLHVGSTDVEILFLGRAHTGGDLEVYLPKEKVLFMSEAFLPWLFPAMRSAYPSEWVQTVKNAQTIDATWYIPGHGFVDDAQTLKADLSAFGTGLGYVVAEATRLHDAGVPCAPAARGGAPCEAVTTGNWGGLAQWTTFGTQVEIAVRRVYDELDGKLR